MRTMAINAATPDRTYKEENDQNDLQLEHKILNEAKSRQQHPEEREREELQMQKMNETNY